MMRANVTGLALAVLIPAVAGSAWARSEPQVPPPQPPVVAVAAPMPVWLAGAWVEERKGTWTEEYWSNARGDLMLGGSKSGVRESSARMFEHARIERGDGGLPTFVAHPMGSAGSAFPMVARGATMIEFANAAHDYPQRIRYWREGPRLRARISMMDGSRPHEWTFRAMATKP